MQDNQMVHDYFPIGTRVLCENECFPGRWQQGTVVFHRRNRFDCPQWLGIKMDDDPSDTVATEYDYRYIDIEDSRNSLVKKVNL